MINGLEVFTDHFAGHSGHYVLIGGGACDVQFKQKDLEFRKTKDLDIVLIVEALTPVFVNHFWDFIKAGEYALAQIDEKKCFYWFIKPQVGDFPVMLELFARQPDMLPPAPGIHITDIPTSDEASSLSAILMNNDYYHFTIENSEVIDGVRIASDRALIVLKARAFLNNRERKVAGQHVQEDDILKHRNDILRLTATLPLLEPIPVPAVVKADLLACIDLLPAENMEMKNVFKPMGIPNVPLETLLQRLKDVFTL